jgi:hypothetical protein
MIHVLKITDVNTVEQIDGELSKRFEDVEKQWREVWRRPLDDPLQNGFSIGEILAVQRNVDKSKREFYQLVKR